MEALEQNYRSALIGATIQDVTFFIAGENFLVFDPDHTWVLDIGMEMVLDKTTISFAVNLEMQLWDLIQDKIEALTGALDIFELEEEELPAKASLVGQKIKDVSFNWNWYHKLDEDFVPVQEKTYIPFEMKLHLENGSTLQLATIIFKLENDELSNPKFNSQGQLLVSLNKLIEIEDVD